MIIMPYMNKPLCTINTGRTVEDSVPYLKDYPAVYILSDRNVEAYAARVAESTLMALL